MDGGRPTHVVIGANLAGGSAVVTMRSEGFDGRIVLVGEEAHPPYERPPLSKEYLRGETSFEKSFLVAPSWYIENDVDLRLGTRCHRVDVNGRAVELDGGERIAYDAVLVATGGRNRRLRVPGADLEGIFELRTREDADHIREAASQGRRAVVVGAGFIGTEVAASLRDLGLEVAVVELFDAPLVRVLGSRVGRVLEGIHRDRGVRFHFSQVVARFEGHRRVERVVTDRGTSLDCDFVVVGVGIEPSVDVVRDSGLRLENGIAVDARCRSSVEGIYAAGDVANHQHPLFGASVRVEHWDNALKQGAAAARNMIGREEVFDDPHWFWSDQFGVNIQYVGHAPTWDELVVRGSIPDLSFVAFYLKDGLVVAAAGLGRGKDVRRAAALVRARRPIDRRSLRDDEVDLRKLAVGAA
ncbi:MAG: FAD-dependent oxidoreductase [Actinobacteria bacterium]|nr:FAD-dependent oxidoreductase [Actinomycetota bacterium]